MVASMATAASEEVVTPKSSSQRGGRGSTLTTEALMPLRLRRNPDDPLINPEHPFAPRARAILNAAYVIGSTLPDRRFSDMDVEGIPWLRKAAELFCVLYDANGPGELLFIQEVRADARSLTVAQARGVLNCMMHDGEGRIARRTSTLGEADHSD